MTEPFSQPALLAVGDPFKEPVSAAKMAEVLGVDIRSVQNWDEKGWVTRRERGFYILGEFIRGLYDGQREIINKKKPETPLGADGKPTEALDAAELRKKIAEANIRELEEAEKRKDLLPRAEIENAAFEKARQLREAFENIPSRIGDILAAETEPAKIKDLLGREINKVLEDLSK